MNQAARDHLDRRAFLARMVGSAFALGVAGKIGLPEAMAEPRAMQWEPVLAVDWGTGPSWSLLVRIDRDTHEIVDWKRLDAPVGAA